MVTTTKQQELHNALKSALTSMMQMHPSQREALEKLSETLGTPDLDHSHLAREMKRLQLNIMQEKDRDAVDLRFVVKSIKTQMDALKTSPHLSQRQRDALSSASFNEGDSVPELLGQLNDACNAFAQDAIQLREQEKVIVGDGHQHLKRGEANIIAGDVAWSSRQILQSLSPLLARTSMQYPDNTEIKGLCSRLKEMQKNKSVDFFDAVSLLEDANRQLTRLQGKRNEAEAEYLLTFHAHLRQMQDAMTDTIKENDSFLHSNEQDRNAILELMDGFTDVSQSETDPEKLRSIIAENVAHMRDGFQRVMKKQDLHIRKQQRTMEALRSEAQDHERQYKALQQQQRELSSAMQKIEEMSLVDELTQVGNRRAYENCIEALDESLAESKKYESFGMLVFDIDHFKRLNDGHGHAVGDRVLQSVSGLVTRLIERAKLKDKVEIFRYGGEEFVLVYHNMSIMDAAKLAERLRRCIEKADYKVNDKPLSITVSIGVSSYSGLDRKGASVFEIADQSMYRAKNTGRNRVVVSHKGRYKNTLIEKDPNHEKRVRIRLVDQPVTTA